MKSKLKVTQCVRVRVVCARDLKSHEAQKVRFFSKIHEESTWFAWANNRESERKSTEHSLYDAFQRYTEFSRDSDQLFNFWGVEPAEKAGEFSVQ